jgi:AGCS family alanine or glycine:cation symporter
VLANAREIPTEWTGVVLMVLTAPILFRGVRRVARGREDRATGDGTQAAVAAAVGPWCRYLMPFLITVSAFSSVLGNYSYAEVNLFFLGATTVVLNIFRAVVLLSIAGGAVAALAAVWAIADIAMA